MNIKPWRQVQPDFPPKIIGHILSAYYGGRAEVHIRRQIVPIIHCDFPHRLHADGIVGLRTGDGCQP